MKPSLSQVLEYLGHKNDVDFVVHEDAPGEVRFLWLSQATPPTQAEIDAAELPAAKSERIESDRTECHRRLTEFYGDALEQVSRASGLYGATAQANHAAGVSAAIDASNVARDQINAATTVAEVEAVTVAWPTLT